MTAKQHTPGEIIPLYWDMEPQSYYVAGHVDEAAFRGAMESLHGADVLPAAPKLRHAYARYVKAGSNCSGVDRVLQESKRGRGAMPVTVWDVP